MVQNIINLGEREDRVLNIIKAKFGFKNKSEAVAFLAKQYEANDLEPELRPEYIEKLKRIEEEGYGESFTSIDELRKKIGTGNG